jgi:hypothetical protein
MLGPAGSRLVTPLIRFALALVFEVGIVAHANAQRPNILLIVADDLVGLTSPVMPTAQTKPAATPPPTSANFACTMVIGYSQVGQHERRQMAGWYVAGGVFESLVANDRWQLLWRGGAGVDRWRNPDYQGWQNEIQSPCTRASKTPDRIVLSISGPYGADEHGWADAIQATVGVIRHKYPSARQIALQPVVGGPRHESCPTAAGGRVRASWQHAHIDNAIAAVVGADVIAGFSPEVWTCDDYADGLGHLKPEAASAVARKIAEHYGR